MRHIKHIRKEHVGQPIRFLGFDGEVYFGRLLNVWRRGVEISYYVHRLNGECQTHIVNNELHRVTIE